MSQNLNKYLVGLRREAIRFERMDINGKESTNYFRRHFRRIFCFVFAGTVFIFIPSGFSQNFISYASTVLSILVGLFITAIIFSFDKFYSNLIKELSDYDITIKRDGSDTAKSFEVSVKEMVHPNATQKLWDTQSHNYSKQFAYLTGYNIILSVLAIALLSFSALFPEFMETNIWNYSYYEGINGKTAGNFLMVTFIVLQRFLVLYWMLGIMYNTLFIVSSMVNFMIAKIDRSND